MFLRWLRPDCRSSGGDATPIVPRCPPGRSAGDGRVVCHLVGSPGKAHQRLRVRSRTLVQHPENTRIFEEGCPEPRKRTVCGIAHNTYYGKFPDATSGGAISESGAQFFIAHARQGFIYLGEACLSAGRAERVRREGAAAWYGTVARGRVQPSAVG